MDNENFIPFVELSKSGDAISVQVIFPDWFQTAIIIPDLIFVEPEPTPRTQ